MQILGVPLRSPEWSDIVLVSFVAMMLLVAITIAHASGLIVATTAREMALGGIAGLTLRAYGVNSTADRWRALVLLLALGIPLYAFYTFIAAVMAG